MTHWLLIGIKSWEKRVFLFGSVSLLYFWVDDVLQSRVNPLATIVPHYTEASQLICRTNQLTGFYMIGNIGS